MFRPRQPLRLFRRCSAAAVEPDVPIGLACAQPKRPKTRWGHRVPPFNRARGGAGVFAPWIRPLLAATLALAGAVAPLRAQTPELELTAEEIALLNGAAIPTWDFTGNFRGSFGYKENLLLSAVRTENSGFAQAEAEFFAWRVPTERFEAVAFANATLTRFFDSKENPREVQAFAHGEARWFLSPALQATGVLEAYHLDQVFDLSATAAEQLTAQLAVRGVLATTEFRWQATPRTWLELKPGVQRDRYEDGSDDHRQHFGRLSLGRTFASDRMQLSFAVQTLRRAYDRREQYTSDGDAIGRTHLVFQQREIELGLEATLDEARRWTAATSLVQVDNDDNGSGYFDYEHRYLRGEIAWTRTPWKARLTGRTGRYDYDVQRVRTLEAPLRRKHEYLVQARVERQWTPQTRLYADYLWERSRSNDPLASYRVKTASAGVDWEF